jgi:hypothetical protein
MVAPIPTLAPVTTATQPDQRSIVYYERYKKNWSLGLGDTEIYM